VLRPNAVKIRDVLASLQEPGDTLVLGAMLLRHERGIVDATGIPDLGGIGVTLEQEGLWSSACRIPNYGHDDERFPSNSHAVEATLPYANGKRWGGGLRLL
jgi:hypothetical protein